jgi:hypothetical protein
MAYAGSKSQNQKPIEDDGCVVKQLSFSSLGALYALKTFSPIFMGTGCLNIGPSKTKEWYSPFSPHVSTFSGSASTKD